MKILNLILFSLTLIQGSEAKLSREMELAVGREFDESVVGMVFGISKAGEYLYPKILISHTKIEFTNEKGIILSEIAILKDTRVIFSKKGHFVGIVDFFTDSVPSKSALEIKFEVFNERGEWLWKLKRTQEYDYPLPGFYISDKNGSVVMSDAPQGVLYFYNNKGELVREVDLFKDDKWNNERSIACCLSSDGNYFIVNALKSYGSSPEKTESFVILFDDTGGEIWRKRLKEKISANVEIASSGNYIVASGYTVSKELDIKSKSSFLLNKDGETIYRYPWLFTQAVFSSDGRYLVLGEKNKVRLIETGRGEVLWEEKYSKRIRALDVSRYGLVLVKTARGKYKEGIFVYYDPAVSVITPGGEKVYGKEFTGSQFYYPNIKILDSGEGFAIAFSDRFLFYK